MLLLAILEGCGEPAAPVLPSGVTERMFLFMVIDPSRDRQVMEVAPMDVAGSLDGLEATLHELQADGSGIVVAEGIVLSSITECTAHAGASATGRPGARCIAFDTRPRHGSNYRVVLRAEGRPSAMAEVRVPGAYAIEAVDAGGEPPGSEFLRVQWQPSAHARRYFVTVVPAEAARGCEECDDWFLTTEDTSIATSVPREILEGSTGPWTVLVAAADPTLGAFLLGDGGGELFPVPPNQNVSGGVGIVGAWVRREWTFE